LEDGHHILNGWIPQGIDFARHQSSPRAALQVIRIQRSYSGAHHSIGNHADLRKRAPKRAMLLRRR
jgi:hypothetical protein